MIVACIRCGASVAQGSTPCRCSLVVEAARCRGCGLLHEVGRPCSCTSRMADVVLTAASMGGVTEATLDAASRALRERAS